MRKVTFFFLFLIFVPIISQAGWRDSLNNILDSVKGSGTDKETPESITAALTDGEITQGIIEALRVGAERAVETASSADGFLGNPDIRIPLPETMEKVGEKLRFIGLGKQVDTFEETLNRAAEKASAEALPVLGETIQELTFEDVRKIWKGGDTAATDFFKEKTWSPLHDKYKPLVSEATEKVGVTNYYKAMVGNPLVRSVSPKKDLDLDHYVTEKALEGLFTLLAEEEKKIRTEPVARTSDLLKKVFGFQ